MLSEAQKKLFIGAFLQKKYPKTSPSEAQRKGHAHFTAIALEILAKQYQDIVDFNTVITTNSKDPLLHTIFQLVEKAMIFDTTDKLLSTGINERALLGHRATLVGAAYNLNYTSRPTTTVPEQDKTIHETQKQVLEYLTKAIKGINKEIDLTNPELLQKTIKALKKAKDGAEPLLTLLKDYVIIQNLSTLHVHQVTTHGHDQQYCVITTATTGVTAKVALAKVEDVIKKLSSFVASPPPIKDYLATRDQYQFDKIQAIIKLPKHGDIIEVQREAIALNIARLLGFKTPQATMLSHQGMPCLFVPFDNIQLLSEVAQGQTKYAVFGSTGKPYLDSSIITPAGEGLQADRAIDDFGNTFAFFYLCNDPDAFGGYNQNKAIINGKDFYVFDQVVKERDVLTLDSRVNLESLKAYALSRHTQGRNKTLADDNHFLTKFASILDLVENRDNIIQMLDTIIANHDAEIARLRSKKDPLTSAEQATFRMLQALHVDAITIKNKVLQRLDRIFDNFPTLNKTPLVPRVAHVNQSVIQQALILEKCYNNPVLFTVEGRPYKHPWTAPHRHTIADITLAGEYVILTFNSKVDVPHMSSLLNKMAIDPSRIRFQGNSIEFPKKDLKKISDELLYPEHTFAFNPEANYLDPSDLDLMIKSYQAGPIATTIVGIIESYKKDLAQAAQSKPLAQQLEIMKSTLSRLKKHATEPGHQGFLMHLQKKLHFDIQQRLQHIINNSTLNTKIGQAFNAAVTLDRIAIFNQVLMTAIATGSLNNIEFTAYLHQCRELPAIATDYNTTKQCSEDLHLRSQTMITKMQSKIEHTPEKPSTPQISPAKIIIEKLMAFNREIDTMKKDSIKTTSTLDLRKMLLEASLIQRDLGLDRSKTDKSGTLLGMIAAEPDPLQLNMKELMRTRVSLADLQTKLTAHLQQLEQPAPATSSDKTLK